MRKTKIVCTLGPASAEAPVMEAMLRNGLNVARLNFSHGTQEQHLRMIETFRRVRDALGFPAAVMLDTKGPEIRLRDFKDGGATVAEGAEFTLTTDQILGDGARAAVSYRDLPGQLSPGTRVLIDDGRIAMEVVRCTDTEIRCLVLEGGRLSNHKSVNVPNVPLDMPYLSEPDKSDLLFGIENGVDFVAASFVRRAEDVTAMRKFLDYNGGHALRIIAKIENLEGVDNFDAILSQADGIMVARGDMGVEIAYERLPGLQKRFIRRCYQSGKMVITATQMLESMVGSLSPTRAEITDVANAVFDGTSAVMLSGESAIGRYPAEAVLAMARIAEQAERDAFAMNAYKAFRHDTDVATTSAISDAACHAAQNVHAKAIVTVTKTGFTARSLSKFRPYEPIIAATPEPKTFHQLSLSWGVYPVRSRYLHNSDELFQHAIDCAKQDDMVRDGDLVVIAAGLPLNTRGSTNTLKVQTVGASE